MSVLRSVPGIAVVAGLCAALLVMFGTEAPDRERRGHTRHRSGEEESTPNEAPLALPMAAEPQHNDNPADDIISLPLPAQPAAAEPSHYDDPLDGII